MFIIALTGGIATGKSTVLKIFENHDFPIIDQDVIARQIVVPGSFGLSKIIDSFGKEYLTDQYDLDRLKLGNLVFSDPEKLKILNSIMSPLINDETLKQLNNFKDKNKDFVIVDSPLTIESGNYVRYYPIIVVGCLLEQQIARLMKRNGFTEEQALKRINSQMSFEKKKAFANYIIDTSGTKEESKQKVLEIIFDLKKFI